MKLQLQIVNKLLGLNSTSLIDNNEEVQFKKTAKFYRNKPKD